MAIINSNEAQKKDITELYNLKDLYNKNKIAKTTLLFKETKADISSLELVDQYNKKAIDSLNNLNINQNFKNEFIAFANNLMKRDL